MVRSQAERLNDLIQKTCITCRFFDIPAGLQDMQVFIIKKIE